MAEMEKFTINVTVVDLGKIDLLVQNGFYSTRTDFVKDAIRKTLDEHKPILDGVINRRAYSVGISHLSRASLQQTIAQGVMLEVSVLGMLVIAGDVTPDLARRAIKSLEVRGVLKASPEIKQALADRML